MKSPTVLARAVGLAVLTCVFAPLFFSCEAESLPQALTQQWRWDIPQQLSDSNTQVSFEVDSTWHLIKGITSGVDGRVWLADSADPLSIRANVRFPLDKFATGGDSRDERMREVMDSKRFPYVTLAIDSFDPQCAPQVFTPHAPCSVTLSARLSIRGNERPITLTATLVRELERVTLSGNTRFLWADFGVEDPSILIATLDPEVMVSYTVRLPAVKYKEG